MGRPNGPTHSKTEAVVEYAQQAERLGQYTTDQEHDSEKSTQAVEARFITSQDPVIETANGGRLPAVPLEEATKLNSLKDVLEDRNPAEGSPIMSSTREAKDGTVHGARPKLDAMNEERSSPDAPLREALPPSKTNPLFPPLPLYGPPSLMRDAHCLFFRITSAILSFYFLLVILLGALFTSIPSAANYVWKVVTFRNPHASRPFFHEEQKRQKARKHAEKIWWRRKRENGGQNPPMNGEAAPEGEKYAPLEGGPDPLVCDVRYYARCVGLECEAFKVQTEDGFIIDLWHIYDPHEARPAATPKHEAHEPDVFQRKSSIHGDGRDSADKQLPLGDRRYPVLMMHGLLQSAGAFCCNDDDSLAFYLAKSGYDVWLGNNRCGFEPRHNLLDYNDPRMWAWNIRQMGVMDLPALISRVLTETGFPKLALIAHSQGTTQTFVALAKEQRPEIGEKISVFCALAPAVYAGPLIGKMYFKFMRVINPYMFRCLFGIHSFIPFMMSMHGVLPSRFYGFMGYLIFSFLFNWTDERWELALRDRFFQFAPVYVSAESMRWWLGRECFARQKCILTTRQENRIEDEEDANEDHQIRTYFDKGRAKPHPSEEIDREDSSSSDDEGSTSRARKPSIPSKSSFEERARYAWYAPPVPPMAFWICGNDDLVDGRRLMRRFERGREPYVKLVHSKIIEGYEHLDVIWAMDSIEKVGSEVKETIWKTVNEGFGGRAWCRTPTGCEEVPVWQIPKDDEGQVPVDIDATTGEWAEDAKKRN